jgi:hypothetical protein
VNDAGLLAVKDERDPDSFFFVRHGWAAEIGTLAGSPVSLNPSPAGGAA